MASPLGHVSVGLAVAAGVARVTGTPETAAFWEVAAVASMVPDMDVVLLPLGFPRHLHRHATHSLFFLLAATLFGLGLTHALKLNSSPGFTVCWMAALVSHPALDLVTTGPRLAQQGWGIPLFWPFSPIRLSVSRPLFVGDRPESVQLSDTFREMAEDAVRIVPLCVAFIVISRLHW